MWNIPNLLTLGRIVAVVPLFFCIEAFWWTAAFTIFIAAALTDLLDGWIARRWRLTSEFGRFLDPLADKVIVAGALIALVAVHVIYSNLLVGAVVALVARELVVSGIREFLGLKGFVVSVSRLAKWKTATQLAAITFLMAGGLFRYPSSSTVTNIWSFGALLLLVSTILAWITAWGYFRSARSAMRQQ